MTPEQELAERLDNLKRAGAGQRQIDQETRNFWLAQDALKKPRHERALPSAAFTTSRKALSAEAVAYWSTPVEERKAIPPEPDEATLRKEISAEHRRLSKEGGDPGKLQALLKKKRGAK